MEVCVNSISSMVKPYKVDDSVICDNLISIEIRGKTKPTTLKSSPNLLPANKYDQQNSMANESVTAATTPGENYCRVFAIKFISKFVFFGIQLIFELYMNVCL